MGKDIFVIYEKTNIGIHIYYCGSRKDCRVMQMQREEFFSCKIKELVLLVDEICDLR